MTWTTSATWLKRLIRRSGHSNLNYSVLQSFSWWRRLQIFMEKKGMANDGEVQKVQIKKVKLFEVKRKTLFYTRTPGQYQHSPRSKSLSHKSLVQQDVHFCRKRPSFSDAIHKVDYEATEKGSATYPGWKTLMSTVPKLLQRERFYKKTEVEAGFKPLINPDQKSSVLMKNILQKLTKPGSLAVDACTSTFSVARYCMLLPNNRIFIKRKKVPSCMTEEKPQLVLLYA